MLLTNNLTRIPEISEELFLIVKKYFHEAHIQFLETSNHLEFFSLMTVRQAT